MTTALATPVAVRPAARRTGPSLPSAVWLEVRKSLSTRSGMAVAAAALLIGPAAMALAAGTASEDLDDALGPLVVTGLLGALVLLSLGALSTAGEWTHGSIQTTFLLEPRRGRVMAAKAAAVALMGAVIAVVASGLSVLVLLAVQPSWPWDGVGRAILMVAVAGAAFALIGAGFGAAVGNTAGALTGIYLLNLGVLPILQTTKPELADKIDPGNAILELAQGDQQVQSVVILTVWVGVALIAGTVMTRRRQVS
ncbi:ABC transporter permease [Blastococcus sp. URHD0036]|uniref:ABC transporter permease n=1 Tax=Blastococcus sp. URHD0036 TaxID=1380356 RepID=UPI0004982E30|nr:ABC transporter permease [Blastococcus sp. URHD0036]